MQARLERSTTNRVVAGVCAGIAEYLQVDVTLVRVFFVVAAILSGGLGILAYIVLVVLMPLPGKSAPFVRESSPAPASAAVAPTEGADEGAAELTAEGGAAKPAASPAPPPDPEAAERRRTTFGYFLIALGVIFLLGNVGVFRVVRWDLVWPFVLIGVGALLLAQRMRR